MCCAAEVAVHVSGARGILIRLLMIYFPQDNLIIPYGNESVLPIEKTMEPSKNMIKVKPIEQNF